tara:strand:+ start:1048 stop:2928 length:1881 start_codon:yes stop_codon:yes gene_type:complete
MAQINIRMGGQTVPVDVPDFAMESTQSSVLATLQQIANGQSAIQASNRGVSQGDAKISNDLKSLNANIRKDQRERLQEHARTARRMYDGVTNGVASGISNVAGKGGMGIGSLFGSLGMGMMATQFGMVTGQAETLAKALAYGGRIGLSYGDDMLRTNEQLAGLGLTLSDFAGVIGGNLTAFKELGGSVEEGSKVFLKQLGAFRDLTKEQGYFGMLSGEMAQFMGEELEIRRKMMSLDEYRLYVENNLVDSMNKNFILQEKMAKLTGEDVRDRIAGQMEMRRGAIAGTFLRNATAEQQEAFKNAGAGLGSISKMGPAGQQIVDAIKAGTIQEGAQGIVAGEMMAKSPAVAALINETISDIRNGVSGEQVNLNIVERLQSIQQGEGGMADSSLVSLALAGDKTAEALLTFRNELVEISKTRDELEAELGRKATPAEIRNRRNRGLGAETEELQRNAEVLVQQFIKGIAGGETKDVLETYTSFMNTFKETFASDDVKSFIESFGVAFGEAGLQPLKRVLEDQASWTDSSIVLGNIVSALGATGLGAAMSMPGYINAAMEGFKHLKENNPNVKTIDDVIKGNATLSVNIGDITDAAARKIAQMNEAQSQQPINGVLPTLPSSADQNATVQ